MSTIALMTVEELLAMPDDGVERELIRGCLKERPMTRRNRFHAMTEANVVFLLKSWQSTLPEPRGMVASGEVGCLLRRDPDTTVGIDVAYFTAELMQRQSEDERFVDGPPALAVEILSPSDKQEDIHEKVTEYLNTGVKLVWIVDPDFRYVVVHRPDGEPELFNEQQSLTGGHVLPGFSAKVGDIFRN